MTPQRLLIFLTLFSTLTLTQQKQPVKKADTPAAIHQSALIIDTHADTPQRFLDEHFDLGQDTPVSDGHEDLGKTKKGTFAVNFFPIGVDPNLKAHPPKREMDLIDSFYQQAARHPKKMPRPFPAADIVRARQQHKFAALMGIEGGHA